VPASRLKTAQVNLRIEPALKQAAEKAAAADRRSLTSLIEKLLSDYLKKAGYSNMKTREPGSRAKRAAKAADMAGQKIDQLGDKSASHEVRAQRKRRLIKGPSEFREMRGDALKSKR
jgi:hypothetical protein